MSDRRSTAEPGGIAAMDERSREIFRHIVEAYLETGGPVGSRTISRQLPMQLSPASIRNVMQDLEELGLLAAPHVSAGRVPTQAGLRMFVDGLLQVGELAPEERAAIEAQAETRSQSVEDALSEVSNVLSGLSRCAGVVLASKAVGTVRHIEFVPLDPGRALVVLVGEDGNVENRVIEVPAGLTPSALSTAANYLNHHLRGMSLAEARARVETELRRNEAELDALSKAVVEAGLAVWADRSNSANDKLLIVRGRSNLLTDASALEDLERIGRLFDDLESKRDLIQLLGLAEQADGVRIFIGSENTLFSLSGSSMIVAPYHDQGRKIVGVLGIIGPTRMNYGRIIPMVDYTARVLERMLR
jgi:heat-inducible transcriptional repressor